MWFLFKGTFWFSLVLVMLPFFDQAAQNKLKGAPQVELSDAFTAASGAYDYAMSLCSEKPDVCVKGGQTIEALGYRAKEGALVAYSMLEARFKDKDEVAKLIEDERDGAADPTQTATILPADNAVTGTIPVPSKRPKL